MEWINITERLPQVDQTYVVSITIDNYTFNAIAFFESGDWFYSVKGEKGDQITEQINGWVDNLGVYVG